MSTVTIRLLTDDDLPRAHALSLSAGWNQRVDDWRMLRRLAPRGSFAAVSDDRIVGTAIGIDYARFGWIAMMLVEPALRGHGIGRRLLDAAMSALPAGLPIRLDATPLGRFLYAKCGFADESTLTRHVARTSAWCAAATGDIGVNDARIRPMITADLRSVVDRDREVFGGDRGVLLDWLFREGASRCYVAEEGGGPIQYCLGRAGRLFEQIGPVVAGDEKTAQALVDCALAAAVGRGAVGLRAKGSGETSVVIDAFDSNPGFTAWLAARGFEAQRPLVRMCRQDGSQASARHLSGPASAAEYAIAGPEFA